MKFNCNQQELAKALNIVSKAVSVRTTIPTLKGILMEVKDAGTLVLTASDMDITIEDKIAIEDGEVGSLVVPAKLFGDIIRKMPAGFVQISTDGEKVHIKCNSSEFDVIGMPADEFPNIKNTEEDAKEMVLDCGLFSTMIRRTAFAASVDQTKGVITGILVELSSDQLRMVAIDGYRMAINTEPSSNETVGRFIISAHIMSELGKILTDASKEGEDETVTMLVDSKSAVFRKGDLKIVTRMIAGEFIAYDKILPKNATIEVVLRKAELTESVERASLLSKEGKNNLIKMALRDHVMTITSRSEEGNVKEDLLIEKEGDDLDIGFNARYMMDILRAIDDEEIRMQFSTAVSPCLILPKEGEAYQYLILPVRLNNL